VTIQGQGSGDLELELDRLLAEPRPRVLLASDFDGTLSNIVRNPGRARPVDGAVACLERLVPLCAGVLVISGRAQGDLERLLPAAGVELRGDFGLLGTLPRERSALQDCARDLRAEFGAVPGVRLEVKPGALSLHHRERPELGVELLARTAPLALARGLVASPGRAVVEIRPSRADKSAAVAEVIRRTRPDAVIYAGDDEGDRLVFAMLASGLMPSLRLGVNSNEAAPGLFDHCQVVLPGPLQVVAAFRRLGERLDRSDRVGPGAAG